MAVAHSLCSAPKYVHYTHTREKEKKKYRIFYRATLNGFLFICFIRLHRIHLFIDRMFVCCCCFFRSQSNFIRQIWSQALMHKHFILYDFVLLLMLLLVFLCVFIHSLSIRFIVLAYRRLLRFFLKGFQENFISTIFVLLDVWKDLLNHRTKIHTEWDYAHSQVSTIII